MKTINDIAVGDRHEYIVSVTQDLHDGFASLSGDNSPIHTSKEFAKGNGYPDRLGYAFLLTTFLSKIYGTQFPGGSELCLKQECNFPNPYFVGDLLAFTIVVKNINESLKLMTAHTVAVRNGGEVVFKGDVIFQLKLS